MFPHRYLPTRQSLYVAAGIVRWVRGEEYGVETLVMDEESGDDMDDYLALRIDSIMEPGR